MTDAFTKYAEAIAIPNKEAETVAMEIFIHWICRFGSPVQIHSDNGTEFVNKLSKELFKLLEIKHTTTTPGHPQCNAQAEVFNKTMAKYLASFVDESTLDWEQYLPALQFSYNTSYHSTISTTPFELLYGMKPRTPSIPGQDVQRKFYGESFASERLQILILNFTSWILTTSKESAGDLPSRVQLRGRGVFLSSPFTTASKTSVGSFSIERFLLKLNTVTECARCS